MDPVAQSGGSQPVWSNAERTAALCNIKQNPNSWVYVNGVGWKKLADNFDSAAVALAILAANAKPARSDDHCRDETDGMIHETYVW